MIYSEGLVLGSGLPGLFKYFLIIVLSAIALTLVFQHLFVTDAVYYDALGEHIEANRIQLIIEKKDSFDLITYLLIPVFYLIKFTFITTCLYTGIILSGKSNVGFSSLMLTVILSEGIFLIAMVFKIAWFALSFDSYTLVDIQYFYPFSLLNLYYQSASLEPLLIYPLQLINPFEAVYCIALSYGLRVILANTFLDSLKIVLLYYGIGILFWIVTLSFLIISI